MELQNSKYYIDPVSKIKQKNVSQWEKQKSNTKDGELSSGWADAGRGEERIGPTQAQI